MAKKSDFDMLDQEIGSDIRSLSTSGRNLKPAQFDPKFLEESKAKKAAGLYMIPVEDIIPFQQKGGGDFSEWDEEELEDMAKTMDDEGSYEPILVRQCTTPVDGSVRFEVLAGEHRVKASKIKGLKTIKAIVFRGCSDQKAMDIFLLTNLHRRKSKISDAIYGWSMFDKAHPRIKSAKDFENAICISEYASEGKLPMHLGQYYRYVKMAKLNKEIIEMLDDNKISFRVGYQLSRLPSHEQTYFMPYMNLLTESKLQEIIQKKKDKEIEITPEYIEEYFSEKKKKEKNGYDGKLRKCMKSIRSRIEKSINPAYYDQMDEIFDKAIEEYLKSHPDLKSIQNEEPS